jgi:Flp pilus assembly pilin Flp
MHIKNLQSGQTFLEYVLVISVVAAIMLAMSTMVRRSVQGMVKAVADQVGFQQNAEQEGGESGYLVNMTARLQRDQRKGVRDRLGNVTYTYDDRDTSQTFVLTNMGAQ